MHTFLNWLVQGGVVALAAAAALRLVPRARAHTRYLLVWGAYAAVLLLPVAPYLAAATAPLSPVDGASLSMGPVVSMPAVWWTSTRLGLALWAVWAGIHAARVAVAAAVLRRIRRQCAECPADVEARLHQWSRAKASGRRTRIVLSAHVRSAAVLGWGSPVIALSPALLKGISDADLDRVVIHEWAHVQRRDDIAQLIQRLVQLVAGWHPAIHWLGRQLDLEREVACDEIAVAATGSAREYATCLTTLASLPAGTAPSLPVLSAASSHGLRRRIIRILAAHHLSSVRPRPAFGIVVGAVGALLALVIGNVQVVESAASSLRPVPVPQPAIAATPRLAPPDPTTQRAPAVAMVTGDSPSPIARKRPEPPADELAQPAAVTASSVIEPPPATEQSLQTDVPSAALLMALEVPAPPDASVTVSPELFVSTTASDVQPIAEVKAAAPWSAAAVAGTAIGRRTQDAGVGAARFFTQFGKKVADSF